MAYRYEPRTGVARAVHGFEETAIAVILGLMTIITFANVVLRKLSGWRWVRDTEASLGINVPDSLLWGLEVVVILFAWLVLFGISYAVKTGAHLGVDAIINIVSPRVRLILGLVAAVCCIFYAVIMLKGAYDHWAPFAGLDPTTGRWLPTGFNEVRTRAWYEEDQVPMVWFLRWLEPLINDGEAYDKLPRVVAYTMMPVGAALLLFRLVQATIDLIRGDRESLIASHEAEEALEEATTSREAAIIRSAEQADTAKGV